AQDRGDEPGTVRRTAQRHAARGRAPLPRIRFPERRPYRARRRANRGGLRRDAGPPAGCAAAVTDLAIVGGRVLDPARGVDDTLGIAVAGGRLTGLGEAGPAAETIDASGLVLVPGLVDLHTHLYEGVSLYGIVADVNCSLRGCATAG